MFQALLCPSSGAHDYYVDYHVGHFVLGLQTKNETDATYYFIVLLIGSTCFKHYYAHHQKLTIMMLITTLVINIIVVSS